MKIAKLIEGLQELAVDDEIAVSFRIDGRHAVGPIHGFEVAKKDLAGSAFDGLPTILLAAGEEPEPEVERGPDVAVKGPNA